MALTIKDNSTSIADVVEWTPDHEQILVEWADKAMCYRWLHTRANLMYSRLNALYTIPVIIISTLTGTANFAQNRVPEAYQNYFAMVVGAFNILAGIITTIQQFLKITQLNEAHRVSSISWDKFYRNIKIEIAKHPNERMSPHHMIKLGKEEFDRLMETSPIIPDKIIQYFKSAFEGSDAYKEIVKPEICDVLISTEKAKNSWHNPENVARRKRENADFEIWRKLQIDIAKEENIKMVKEFKERFYQLNNREPMEAEVIDNLKEKMEVEDILHILYSNPEV